MRCAWREFLSILPARIRVEADLPENRSIQELRLRINAPPSYVFFQKQVCKGEPVTLDELNHVIHTASKYSPWCAGTISQGFLTAPGGHRIGVCGEAVVKEGEIHGIRQIRSLCIRIARDYPGLGEELAQKDGSILILGAPGWGKTTLLRDTIRQISQRELVCVVDERRELFPEGYDSGIHTDILAGCPKDQGIERLLRTMGPQWIAVDEITAQKDCTALIHAANCGVRLLATAHAVSREGFYRRPVYQDLIQHTVFQWLVILHKDKSFHTERV